MKVELRKPILKYSRNLLRANRFITKAIAASPFITDAKRNHEAWK